MAKWQDDTEFYEKVIDEVEEHPDGYVVKHDGLCYGGIRKPSPIVPKAGMKIRFFGAGLFTQIRGVVVDGVEVFYHTRDEQDELNRQGTIRREQHERDEFEKNREKMDAQYNALPEPLRRRIDKFRANNAEFRWKYEQYELFCCTQAVVIAEACKTEQGVRDFHALDSWEKQKAAVPGLDGGHSGNTFGCACTLALDILSDPERAVKRHGALAPLVGSKEYGCVPA